jgi:hypothetical protein
MNKSARTVSFQVDTSNLRTSKDSGGVANQSRGSLSQTNLGVLLSRSAVAGPSHLYWPWGLGYAADHGPSPA